MSRARPWAALAALGLVAICPVPAMAAKGGQKAALQDESTRSLYLSLIRQARGDGRARAALAYLDDFDQRHPGEREAQVLRVNCLLDLGQVTEAQAALGRIPSGDRSGAVLAVRGHVLAAQGRWQDAVGEYAAARVASPADPMIDNALGYAQLRAGQSAASVETLRGALDLAPDNTVIRNNLGLALTIAGRKAEADQLLARVPDARERIRLGGQFTAEASRLAQADGAPAPRQP